MAPDDRGPHGFGGPSHLINPSYENLIEGVARKKIRQTPLLAPRFQTNPLKPPVAESWRRYDPRLPLPHSWPPTPCDGWRTAPRRSALRQPLPGEAARTTTLSVHFSEQRIGSSRHPLLSPPGVSFYSHLAYHYSQLARGSLGPCGPSG